MSQFSILVLGDGKNELGVPDDKEVPREDVLVFAGDMPPLPCLVSRLLGEPREVRFFCGSFKKYHAVARGLSSTLAGKVKAAVLYARARGHRGVVIVIDRDRDRKRNSLRLLQEGRDDMACLPGPACALGVAVETFDAWMIADGLAVGDAGGKAAESHASAEKLDGKEGSGLHPKDLARRALGEGLTEKYKLVARRVRLEELERLCCDGFKPFAEEVRKRLGPVVASG